tara:strand:+ start:189 stop:410 length:222 start_codon:yes stop_codon:yes gene_type:complete
MLKTLFLLVVSSILSLPGEQYPQQWHVIETYNTQKECSEQMQHYIDINEKRSIVTACFEAKMILSNREHEGSH